jgi:D-amino peptidase
MRALLWTDMEGMSGITDHRQCWPAFTEYWETGRRAFTDEVVAAATGLLEAGAERVSVINGHGLGWPNLLWSELPDRVGPADDESWQAGFDALFLVGFHARAGTPDGFISHTMVPGLAVYADGAPLTECHIWAWLQEVPVLGISGDHALGAQLDGILEGTPFLAVKHGASRSETVPVHADPADRLAALSSFAAECASRPVRPLVLPERFTFEVALEPDLAAMAEAAQGLTLAGPGSLIKPAERWGRDAQPALQAAIQAALQPMLAAEGGLELDTRDAMDAADPERLEVYRDFFAEWVGA